MWLLVFAWVALLSASVFFASQTSGLDPAHLSALFSALPFPQKFAVGTIIVTALALIGAAIWQSRILERQDKDLRSLRNRLYGIRQSIVATHESQTDFDAAVQHLMDSDPEEAIASLQNNLAETEQKASVQQGRNEAADMQDRLDDIRRRQHALRDRIGVVAKKRQTIEPVFSEIKDRHRQLERSLDDIEIDGEKNHIADRLNELDHNVKRIRTRLKALQDSLATLNRFNEEAAKSKAELVPLQAPETGTEASIGQLKARHGELSNALDQLEANEQGKLSGRVEELSRNKQEIEQRVSQLDDCFNILTAVSRDFEELRERREHLESSLAAVETNSSGQSLVDRQNALSEFVTQARVRVRTLQDSSTTLNRFKEEIDRSRTALVPLTRPGIGIEALMVELHESRDQLVKMIDELEVNGDQKLSSRVEALSSSKLETERRIALIFESFAKLDTIRKDIGSIFVKITSTINRLG
jgi:chromosome segregation ATPase